MERLLNPYDKEYMRMAMLKHEETFKEQVYELHRLYRIQKLLMKNIERTRNNGQSPELRNSANGSILRESNHYGDINNKSRSMKLDLEQPADEYIAETNGDAAAEMLEESEIELTLGLTSSARKKKPETPINSDSGPSFSSSSTGSSHINRTNSLTHQRIRKDQSTGGQNMSLGCQSGSKISIDVEEQLRQERIKQPPWLFQVLSLNMT